MSEAVREMTRQELVTENNRLRAELEAAKKRPLNEAELDAITAEKLQAIAVLGETAQQLAAMTAERDAAQRRAKAAERDMWTYIRRNVQETSGKYACDLCKYGGELAERAERPCPAGCDGIARWEWRGPDAEGSE